MTCMCSIRFFTFRCLHFILRRAAALDEIVYKKMQILLRHQDQQKQQSAIGPIESNEYFQDISLITHAGGGLCGLNYLNCEEAYPVYYENGNRVFEYDVIQDEDGLYALAHKGDGRALLDERFHPMTLEACLTNLREDTDIKVVFDCKFRSLSDFCKRIKKRMSNTELDRVIIQVFSEDNILEVQKAGLQHMLYVCMMDTDYYQAANLCVKYGIGAVSISTKALEERTGWEMFEKCNIRPYAYTVNKISTFRNLKSLGIHGIFSDFLTQKEIEKAMKTVLILLIFGGGYCALLETGGML